MNLEVHENTTSKEPPRGPQNQSLFLLGDMVWKVILPPLVWSLNWEGLYLISEAFEENVYKLMHINNARKFESCGFE